MKGRHFHATGLTLAGALLSITVSIGSVSAAGPMSGTAVAFAISAPVRALPPAKPGKAIEAPVRINPLSSEPDQGKRGTWSLAKPPHDEFALRSQNPERRTPKLDLSFDGTGNPFACGGCS